MKYFFVLLFILSLFLNCRSSIEKEREDLERDKIRLEKEKLEFEKLQLACKKKCFVCEDVKIKKEPPCKCENPPTELSIEIKEETEVPKTTINCKNYTFLSKSDIWKLAEQGGWYYHPDIIKKGTLCDDDKKESYYKIYKNSESYVAKTQIPKTRQSSCINNVVFHGKGNLYKSMVGSAITDGKLSGSNLQVGLNELVDYNNSRKGKSSYFECIPTDSQKSWGKCTCVLFGSYNDGKEGLIEFIKNK